MEVEVYFMFELVKVVFFKVGGGNGIFVFI